VAGPCLPACEDLSAQTLSAGDLAVHVGYDLMQDLALLRRDVGRPRSSDLGDDRLPQRTAVLDDVAHAVGVGVGAGARPQAAIAGEPLGECLEQPALACARRIVRSICRDGK
jgi:hypothetical protein